MGRRANDTLARGPWSPWHFWRIRQFSLPIPRMGFGSLIGGARRVTW
jgi:hypothetical protein